MAKEGRIEGRMSEDGTAYELVQGGAVIQSIPLGNAKTDEKLKAAIKRNSWQEVTIGGD